MPAEPLKSTTSEFDPADAVPPLTPLAAPAPNGVLRTLDSVPYQNSVVSLAGRGCERMIRGVIDSTISVFAGRGAPGTEQAADHRNIPETRDMRGVARVLILDQSGEDLGLAVSQAQERGRIARADFISERSRGRIWKPPG